MPKLMLSVESIIRIKTNRTPFFEFLNFALICNTFVTPYMIKFISRRFLRVIKLTKAEIPQG